MKIIIYFTYMFHENQLFFKTVSSGDFLLLQTKIKLSLESLSYSAQKKNYKEQTHGIFSMDVSLHNWIPLGERKET